MTKSETRGLKAIRGPKSEPLRKAFQPLARDDCRTGDRNLSGKLMHHPVIH